MKKFEEISAAIGIFGFGLSFLLAVLALMVYVVQMLWNLCVVPACSSLNELGYWQTAGILWLVVIVGRMITFKVDGTIKLKKED